MYVDHMIQPWRTLAAIINKSLSGKTTSNDRLRKSKIDIMWVMFYKENVDYPVLIWEYFAYQIDHRKERRSRREDYQEYGLEIPNVTLNDTIKRSKTYQMFIKYSTGWIPPKKSRGKGSQGKKIVDDSQETVDVSKESEPEPVKKNTASRRVVKKKVTLSADDNIIFDDLDAALELGKSMSLTEAEEAKAARKVHATHARIVIESAKRSLVVEVLEAADIMQALKESKKTSKRQPGIGESSEGNGTILGVPDASTVISATSSEGTSTKLGVPDEEKDITEENVILEWGSKQESKYSEEDKLDDEEKDDKEGDADDEGDDHISDTQDTDDEDDETESDEDDIYKYKIRVRKDEDVEMINAKFKESRKGDKEDTDAAKEDVEKTEETKDDSKKAELPPTSSSLSISSGFGDQFLKLSSDTSLIGTVKDTTNVEISSLLNIKIQSEVTHIQSPSVLEVPVSVISEPSVLTPVQETPSAAPETTLLPPPYVSSIPPLRVAKLEKDVSELKKIDHSTKAHATLNASEILKIKKEQAEKQKMPKYTIKSTDKAALKEYDQKSALYLTMHENKSFNRNLANHRLYHALMKALIEDENAMDKGVADTVKDHKRKHDDDDDEDPPAVPNHGKKKKRKITKESESSKKPSSTKGSPKGKAPTKGSKIGKSASTKEPIEEPIAEVVMDDAGEDVVHDDDQPQDTSEPKTATTPNPEWFKQPPRPLTPDPEWNKRQVIFGQPEQPWFNQMVSATKDPLKFNDLMANPIDFSKYVLNRLKIDNLTQDLLLGPAYDLLKGTCISSIKLEYNF
ncbi:hypothetical protein Tco_1353796 [Tanacetum coccineum]